MSRPRTIPNRAELALLSLCLAVVLCELFLPPFYGLANNGDFPKVAGRFALGPESGGWANNFLYFEPAYIYAPQFRWSGGVLSSETALAGVAVGASKLWNSPVFDIRYLGAVHATLFLFIFGAFVLFLRPLPPTARTLLALLALWIFTDICYVAYFNSFYTDTAAFLGLLGAVVSGLYLSRSPNAAWLSIFVAFALLFLTSKAQHGLWAAFPAVLALVACWRRSVWIAACASSILIASAVWMLLLTPASYKGQALFNITFFQLTNGSPTAAQDLFALGLPASDLNYVGMHAYLPESPANNERWLEDFYAQGGYGRLIRFYIEHPVRTFQIAAKVLKTEPAIMRPPNLSNFRQQDGKPAGARTRSFSSWSSLRSALFNRWPGHIAAWYGAVLASCCALIRKDPGSSLVKLAWICLGIASMGILEFALAALTDACETYRHLFIFHALTDLTICFAAAWAVSRFTPSARSAA